MSDKNEPKKKKRPGEPAFMRDLWDVANNVSANVEKVLNTFRDDLVNWQRKVNGTWNTLAVIVHVLRAKGLLTDEDIKKSGVALWESNQRNMAATKTAISERRRVSASDLEESPIEHLSGLINREIAGRESPVVPSEGEGQDETSTVASDQG